MSSNQNDAGVQIRGVAHHFGERAALDGVSLCVPRGRFVALLGPNGAGKSTLLTLLAGLMALQSGRIALAGHDILLERQAALSNVGFVFQEPSLDPDLTVRQNLRYYAALRGVGRRRARAEIDRVLACLDVTDRQSELVRHLNGGHRRRVEIARALIGAPPVLVLDEPTVGLDAPTRAALVAHVHALAGDEGVGILWATHLVDEIEPGDAVVVLHRGRVGWQGEARDLGEGPGLLNAFLQIVGAEAALEAVT